MLASRLYLMLYAKMSKLSSQLSFATIDPNSSLVRVPDDRIQKLLQYAIHKK